MITVKAPINSKANYKPDAEGGTNGRQVQAFNNGSSGAVA